MTPDQAQTRAMARLMDMRDEGLSPEDAINLEVMTLFILIVGMTKSREEAENAADMVAETLYEAFESMEPHQFGMRKKGER